MGNHYDPRDYEKDGIPDLIGHPTPIPPRAISPRQVLRYVDRLGTAHPTNKGAIYADLRSLLQEAANRLTAPNPDTALSALFQVKALIEELENLP